VTTLSYKGLTYPQVELKIIAFVAGEPDETVSSVGVERELDSFSCVHSVEVLQRPEVVLNPVLTVERLERYASPLICIISNVISTSLTSV